MLIAEDLLLLLLDERTGAPRADTTSLDLALGGALLLELALAGRVDVSARASFGRPAVAVVDPADRPELDPLLRRALITTAEKPRTPQALVTVLGKGVRAQLLERLVAAGVLQEEVQRVLGVFPVRRWPAQDGATERTLRTRLHDVLVVGATPQPREVAVVALLSAIDKAQHVVGDLDRRQWSAVRRRAKELAQGDWAGEAVRKAVVAVQAGVAAAGAAATAAVVAAS